ncbi:MAG: hypothetical protein ACK500_03860 [Flavobacteriales bacterium]
MNIKIINPNIQTCLKALWDCYDYGKCSGELYPDDVFFSREFPAKQAWILLRHLLKLSFIQDESFDSDGKTRLVKCDYKPGMRLCYSLKGVDNKATIWCPAKISFSTPEWEGDDMWSTSLRVRFECGTEVGETYYFRADDSFRTDVREGYVVDHAIYELESYFRRLRHSTDGLVLPRIGFPSETWSNPKGLKTWGDFVPTEVSEEIVLLSCALDRAH